VSTIFKFLSSKLFDEVDNFIHTFFLFYYLKILFLSIIFSNTNRKLIVDNVTSKLLYILYNYCSMQKVK